MTVTAASFRVNFPEFVDTSKYPDSMVNFWLAFMAKLLVPDRWADIIDEGLQLSLAHQLTIAYRNTLGAPGGVLAPQSAKAVDKVSASYDTKAVTLENAGHWNGSSYGLQFYQLLRMVGMGVIQL